MWTGVRDVKVSKRGSCCAESDAAALSSALALAGGLRYMGRSRIGEEGEKVCKQCESSERPLVKNATSQRRNVSKRHFKRSAGRFIA